MIRSVNPEQGSHLSNFCVSCNSSGFQTRRLFLFCLVNRPSSAQHKQDSHSVCLSPPLSPRPEVTAHAKQEGQH